MKTIKRLFWTAAATVGLVTVSAAPSFAGVMFNHTENINGR